MNYEILDKAFEFYNIDEIYKERCYKCIKNLNNKFDEIVNELYENEFEQIRKYWDIKDINEMFWNNVDPFITNLVILYGYKYHLKNIKKYNFEDEEIEIQKKRIKECFINDLINKNYKGIRISQMLWAIYFIRGRLIEVGRLQYEYFDSKTVKIHIPSGSKLNYDDVLKSLQLSKSKIEKIYNISDFKYVGKSWILSDEIYMLIDKDSNISKFHDLFKITKGEDCIHDILKFVYNMDECSDYNLLDEKTSLQRKIKKSLLDGNIFYAGIGVLKNNLYYRKACNRDISDIALLVTNLLGTCNLNYDKTPYENNIEEITSQINNYYVCLDDNKIVGACGISKLLDIDSFGLGLSNVREILYLVVDSEYQRKGIGSRLLNLCVSDKKCNILYDAWGDNGKYVNSKFILEKNGFKLYKDLGRDYYKNNGYCSLCVNKDKNCNSCLAEIWLKENNQ